jgi:5-methylcytosine-specific restriction endonuclease McrA
MTFLEISFPCGHPHVDDNIFIMRNGKPRCVICKKNRRNQYLKNKERINAQNREWYANNKRHHKELMQRWYADNLEYQHGLQRLWYVKNRELHLEACRKWSAEHLPLKAKYRRDRRARKEGSPGISSIDKIQARVDYYGGICAYCRSAPYEEIDHVMPLVNGGSNWPSNLRPACRSCNRRKSSKSIESFLKEINQ